MRHLDHHDRDAAILDPADRAIAARAIAPEPRPVADHRLAEGARVAMLLEAALDRGE